MYTHTYTHNRHLSRPAPGRRPPLHAIRQPGPRVWLSEGGFIRAQRGKFPRTNNDSDS